MRKKLKSDVLRRNGANQETVWSVLGSIVESLWWEWFLEKVGFEPRVEQQGSYGW